MPRRPKQETHKGVFQRVKNSGVWWIRYTDEKGRRVTAKVGKYSAAVSVYEARTQAIRVGQLLPPTGRRGTKFSVIVDDAIKFSKNNHRAAKDFKQRVSLLLPVFKDRVADSITPIELQEWMDDTAEEREWSGGTRNRVKSSLSTVFREAMRAGKVTTNPVRLVRRFKESLGRVRFLSDEEEAAIRQAAVAPISGRTKRSAEYLEKHGHSSLYQLDLALHAGMRKSEQFTTTWDQVDLKRGFIYLNMTKNGSDRFVQLNSVAREVLKRLKAEHDRLELPADSTLFHGERGEPIKDPKKWFSTALELAGVKGVSWHVLRHTFASRLVMAGVDLRTVQELMGHKSIAMTARYAHLAPKHQLDALEMLVKPGSVPVQSGRKMATGNKKAKKVQREQSLELFVNQ